MPEGTFSLVAGTDHQRYYDKKQISFILSYDFTINKNNSANSQSLIKLNQVNLKLKHFKTPPIFKVEANVKYQNSYRTSQMFASNFYNRNHFVFYVSDGNYNINLDPISFDPKNTIGYALAQKELSIFSNISFDINFNQLKMFKINMNQIIYGWFKLISQNTGDFQTMYYGKPVNVYTNLDNLRLEMVYIPNQKCINYFLNDLKINNPTKIMDLCDNTNLRYDFADTNIDTKNTFNIYPPIDLDISKKEITVKQGGYIEFSNTFQNISQNIIFQSYIHKLWDQPIFPTIEIKNQNNNIVHKPNLFFLKNNSFSFKEQACLPPGKYTIEISKPVDVWGESKIIKKSIPLTILKGFSCNYQVISENSNNNFDTWEEMYHNKSSVEPYSSGNLTTYPHYQKTLTKPDTKNIFTINSCDDLNHINQNIKTLIININKDEAFNYDNETNFTKCLKRFSSQNPQYTYILKNSFFDRNFPTTKLYVLYHYYLTLHQDKSTSVGILTDDFFDLLYGFQDFSIVDKNNFLPISSDSDKFISVLKSWLTDYPSVTQSPLFLLE